MLIGYSSTFTIFEDGGFEFGFSIDSKLYGSLFSGALMGLVIYMTVFSWKVYRHNKKMPNQKINMLSFRPQEYMEDDELFQEITKRATKRVYSYFVVALPVLAGFYMGLPIGRTWMIFGILFVALGQYWIYYRTIRKYVTEEE